jgi:hypothetical protein
MSRNEQKQPFGESHFSDVFPIDSREQSLDMASAALITNVRQSLTIHFEMFRRVLAEEPRPSLLLQELLEDVANRYLDLAEQVWEECRLRIE